MNSFNLSRLWFAFAYDNSAVKPVHTALYFWITERANASGWKKIVDIQTEKSMECLGITDWRTYKNALQFLADNGFIIWFEKSKNQYTCNRISIIENACEMGASYKNSNAQNAEANAEAIAEAIVEAYAEADVEAIAEALQSYINLKTNKPLNKKTLKPSSFDAPASKPEKIPKLKTLHASAIENFCAIYLEKFHTKYIFSGAKDGTAIKQLLEKIKSKTIEANMESSDENILTGLDIFLKSITDKWVLDNFNPAVINLKFNDLFKNAKNGHSNNIKSGFDKYKDFDPVELSYAINAYTPAGGEF